MKVTISLGKSRKETRWKTKTVEWERLVEKLSQTTRTAETQATYKNEAKDRKSEIKDVGGFVGGAVEGGRRVKGSVKKRSLLTLDLDYANTDVWGDITMMYGCAMCLYSTHSHSADTPRYRLIIPLSREVSPDEHEAIARKVADNIGIDMFDDSTYQAERLMYWPSTSKDAEYVFKEQKGDILDADEVLGEYRDWTDISQWPTSSRTDIIEERMMAKKGEPTERPGAVGAFCRAYTISEAIDKFLSDVYQPLGNDDSRYTYMGGSSSGGLVVYEDKFAYSHHATDPASEQMCNAFDLVRIHLYGDMDENVKSDTPISKYPSFVEMHKRAETDSKVLAVYREETTARLKEDFGDLYEEAEEEGEDTDESWMDELERDKAGNVLATAQNVAMILENAQGLKNNLRRNDFTHTDEVLSHLPWRRVNRRMDKEWTNDDDARLRFYLDKYFGIRGKDLILTCFVEVMTSHRYHPVFDYLTSLKWDGKKRVDSLLIDYLNAEDTKLTRTVTRKFLTAAVARIFDPGCKFDYVTVLQGEQGIGKSTLLSRLAGADWFNDSITDLSGKDAMEMLQGSWLIEMGELQAIKRSEIENVKAFLSRQVDAYRPAYGRTRENHPRQCIFFATTNEQAFLKGSDGNRRFWVVPCKSGAKKSVFDIDENTRNQIWAEAVHIYHKGEKLYLDNLLESEMRKQQEESNEFVLDERFGLIQEYLDKKLPTNWYDMTEDSRICYLADEDSIEAHGTFLRDKVCAIEVIVECLHGRIGDKNQYLTREVNNFLDRIPGWKKVSTPQRFGNYGVQRGYKRVTDEGE